ncbi:MAG: TIM-barrel domain-containing protein [Polyangiales bacterium]
MPRATSTIGPLLLLVLASSCHSSPPTPAGPTTLDASLATFKIHVEPSPLRFSIARADGTLLFDGLPAAPVPAPDPNSATDAGTDPPPRTAIAVRSLPTTQETMFGAFKITETPSQWRAAKTGQSVTFDGATVAFDASDDTGVVAHVTINSPAGGEVTLTITPTDVASSGARLWTSIAGACDASERFQGFGQMQEDVEFHGQTVPIFVSEAGIGHTSDDAPLSIYYIAGTRHQSEFPAPIYLASRGYVGAIEGLGRSKFSLCDANDIGADGLRISEDTTGVSQHALTFHVFDGPDPKSALKRSTARFGRPRMPPRLAFAPWNDGIFGEANVESVAQEIRDKDLPSSVIWTEDFRGGSFSGDNYKLEENWLVDTTLYPDLDGMIAKLHSMGFAWFAYYNTFVEQNNDVWSEASGKFLLKDSTGADIIFTNAKQSPSGLVDLTSADASAWTTQKLKDMLNRGANGWMGDFGEWQMLDAKLADGSDAWTTHDLYPQLWQKAQRAALDATDLGGNAAPADERLTFVRSGWLGTAALADVVWGGDQRTDFEPDDGMPTVIPMGIGMGIAGVSTFTHDIGGYQSATNNPATKEVFWRWAALGAWTPVMRTHHGTEPKLQWHFDSDADTLSYYRSLAIQHLQLFPTWESLAAEATATGVPIWRSLAIEFPNDPQAWVQADEIMVGASLLIAPVSTAGATSRPVYLPSGAQWFAWDATLTPAAAVSGGASITVPASIAQMPVFLRAGSVIVENPERVRTVLHQAPPTLVRVDDIGDERIVVVATGGSSTFKETGGYSYVLTSASVETIGASTAATWNGTALATCATPAVAPCATPSAGRVVATLTGDGTLATGGSTVQITRGGGGAPLVLDVRGDP